MFLLRCDPDPINKHVSCSTAQSFWSRLGDKVQTVIVTNWLESAQPLPISIDWHMHKGWQLNFYIRFERVSEFQSSQSDVENWNMNEQSTDEPLIVWKHCDEFVSRACRVVASRRPSCKGNGSFRAHSANERIQNEGKKTVQKVDDSKLVW